MPRLKHSETRLIDDAFDMHSGYVLDFSNQTLWEFFDEEFQLDIYAEKYSGGGTSKANRLRTFISLEDEFTVARVLRRLWQHRETLCESEEAFKVRFFDLINKIEGSGSVPRTDAIDRFRRDETLDELVAAIERDIAANKPVAALDRLHTYCMKKFAHLLAARQIPCEREEPLHSRVAKYSKALAGERDLREITAQVTKNAIGVFEKFNHVRNNQSFAHDNEILDHAEARFIYDSVTAYLRFLKAVDTSRFGA